MDYNTLTSLDNLFIAWSEFRRGKRNKRDVQIFERHLEDNVFDLYYGLQNKTYRHGPYESFYVHDPKRRHIHKASVRDRVVHHLLYTYLYEVFDKTCIYDSYSCRLDKGTHRAVDRLERFSRKVSKNYSRNCWVLHCDIEKFFANVDHGILKKLLAVKVVDPDIRWLLSEVIDSFVVGDLKGIPLGNLTSQIFANIYLNELDRYVKEGLKIKYYIRYADDFVIIDDNKKLLIDTIGLLGKFLEDNLALTVHPKKITMRSLGWGIDFLGYIVLPHYRLPRTKTKRRVIAKLNEKIGTPSFHQSFQSYLGYLGHANTYTFVRMLKNNTFFKLDKT